jgi:hypothetical protein
MRVTATMVAKAALIGVARNWCILPHQPSRRCEGGLCRVGLTARLFQPRTKQGLQIKLKSIGCRDMLFE